MVLESVYLWRIWQNLNYTLIPESDKYTGFKNRHFSVTKKPTRNLIGVHSQHRFCEIMLDKRNDVFRYNE